MKFSETLGGAGSHDLDPSAAESLPGFAHEFLKTTDTHGLRLNRPGGSIALKEPRPSVHLEDGEEDLG